MRRAVEAAYISITGQDPEFIFSGWDSSLDEPELAVVENRLPSEAHYRETMLRDAAPDMYEALRPFAEKLVDIGDDEADDDAFREMSPGHRRAPRITVGHIRRAAELLAALAKAESV